MLSTHATPLAGPIDLRDVSPRERHTLIFNRFDALGVGDTLELVNDHDPVPLRYQLENRAAGQFHWGYLEQGPALWRVRIAKVLSAVVPAASDSCCSGGACGG